MKRRSFLKGLLAAPFAPLLAKLQPATRSYGPQDHRYPTYKGIPLREDGRFTAFIWFGYAQPGRLQVWDDNGKSVFFMERTGLSLEWWARAIDVAWRQYGFRSVGCEMSEPYAAHYVNETLECLWAPRLCRPAPYSMPRFSE